MSDCLLSTVYCLVSTVYFRNCSRKNTEEHFNSEMVDTCGLVESVVVNCGEIWNRCHTSKEVRRMRDLHIESLVRQYGELGELDDCELVKEYRCYQLIILIQ